MNAILRSIALSAILASPVHAEQPWEKFREYPGPYHLGDEHISSWSPLIGSCMSIEFPSVHAGGQIGVTYEPYGLENAYIEFSSGDRFQLAPQRVLSGRRPNYWGDLTNQTFSSTQFLNGVTARMCAAFLEPGDLDDLMLRNVATWGQQPAPSAPVPQVRSSDTQTRSESAVYDIITGSRWTLRGSSGSCGIGTSDTHYQRFLPSDYYIVLDGREQRSDRLEVEYFRIDEAARTFEASYIYHNPALSLGYMLRLRFTGQLLDDGSMRLSRQERQIDFESRNSQNPRYNERTSPPEILYRCDALPERNLSFPDSSRILISVPEALDIVGLETCQQVFDASFENTASAAFLLFKLANGQWYTETHHTRYCENEMPSACPIFGGRVNTMRQVSIDPLILENVNNGCAISWAFNFEGRRAVVDVSGHNNCSDPFTTTVLECTGSP